MNCVVSSLVYILCFNLSLGLSKSNYPRHFVYDFAWVIVSCDMWTIEGSWFPMTREYLGNLVNINITPWVGHGLVYAALGVRGLGRLRGGSQFRFVVVRSSNLGIEVLDLWIHRLVELPQYNSPQVHVMIQEPSPLRTASCGRTSNLFWGKFRPPNILSFSLERLNYVYPRRRVRITKGRDLASLIVQLVEFQEDVYVQWTLEFIIL